MKPGDLVSVKNTNPLGSAKEANLIKKRSLWESDFLAFSQTKAFSVTLLR